MGLRYVSHHPDPEAGITMAQYERIQERIRLERHARHVMRDIAYRRALGLPLGEELPNALGNTLGAGASHSLHLRGTKRAS